MGNIEEQLYNLFEEIYSEETYQKIDPLYVRCLYFPILKILLEAEGAKVSREEIIQKLNMNYDLNDDDWGRGGLSFDHLWSQRFGKGDYIELLNKIVGHDGKSTGAKKGFYCLNKDLIDAVRSAIERLNQRITKNDIRGLIISRMEQVQKNFVIKAPDEEIQKLLSGLSIKIRCSDKLPKIGSGVYVLGFKTKHLYDLRFWGEVKSVNSLEDNNINISLDAFILPSQSIYEKLESQRNQKQLQAPMINDWKQGDKYSKEDLLKFVREHSSTLKDYDGWGIVTEKVSDQEIIQIIGNAKTYSGAVDSIKEALRLKAENELYRIAQAHPVLVRLLEEYFDDEPQLGTNQIPETTENKRKIMHPLNQILYGPPGTGKTYNTAKIAVEICNGFAPESPDEVMAEYKRLKDLGRISFTTFHQSMGYEEFVEGLRPEPSDDVNSSAFSLKPRKGIFKEVCVAANTNAFRKTKAEFSLNGKDIYKISLGEYKYGEDIYEAAIEGNYVVLGWETKGIDWTNSEYKNDAVALKTYLSLNENNKATDPEFTMPKYFNNMKIGDIVLVSAGNSEIRAIGEITGEYEFDQNVTGGPNKRSVKWLRIPKSYIPISEIYSKSFSMKSCYKMDKNLINIAALESYLNSNENNEAEAQKQNYVLIIDEINRANISKVLGELITLLEDDKRLGADNELTVKLPYSGEDFGVPDNLYLIGTMNSADRSIAMVDIAIRRRFEFKEMMPKPNLLGAVDQINLPKVLENINNKIEYWIGRDFQIGHAYLMNKVTKREIDDVFRYKIIPLLAEYFYEDWEKIISILGDGFVYKAPLYQPINGGEPRYRYAVRDYFEESAYRKLSNDKVENFENMEAQIENN